MNPYQPIDRQNASEETGEPDIIDELIQDLDL